jgi:hypothetical protein
MRLRQADCTRLSLVVSDPYVDVFKRGDERRNKCECYGDSEGRYCSTVDVPFVTHDSSPSPASYRWSYLARPMLQKRKSRYGKHQQGQRHHHVDVPWIRHHTYSYLPNITPILQLFLRRHRRRKL